MTSSVDSAAHWISSLSLSPHPEGGYFKETYRSSDTIPVDTFGERFSGPRSVCTGILYLLEVGDFSAFHRIRSDEMWHFYAGYSLLGCTVSPGFDFKDFEMADRSDLAREFASHADVVARFTR